MLPLSARITTAENTERQDINVIGSTFIIGWDVKKNRVGRKTRISDRCTAYLSEGNDDALSTTLTHAWMCGHRKSVRGRGLCAIFNTMDPKQFTAATKRAIAEQRAVTDTGRLHDYGGEIFLPVRAQLFRTCALNRVGLNVDGEKTITNEKTNTKHDSIGREPGAVRNGVKRGRARETRRAWESWDRRFSFIRAWKMETDTLRR